MTVAINTEGKGAMSVRITGAVSAANGGLGNLANPEGVSLLILRATLRVITPSTGAANLSIAAGVATGAGGVDLVDTIAINGAITGLWYNCFAMQNTGKTGVTVPAVWTAATFLCFTGSADSSGFVGDLYLEYIRA